MRILRLAIKQAIYGLLILFVLLVGFAGFLATTTPGLYLSLKLAALFLPGKLSISGLNGRLADQFTIERLDYTDKGTTLSMNQLDLRWHLRDLIHKQVTIDQLTIARLRLADKEIQAVTVRGQATQDRLQIDHLNAVYAGQQITLQTVAQRSAGLPVNATLNIKSPSQTGEFKLTGDWTRYHLNGQLASFRLKGSLSGGTLFQAELNTDDAAFPFKTIVVDGQASGHDAASFTLYSRIKTRYNESPLTASVNYSQQQFHASASLGTNQLQIDGQLPAKIDLSARLNNLSLLHPALAALKTSVLAKGRLHDLQTGQLNITVSGGQYELPNAMKILFEGGQLKANLSPKGLDVLSQLSISKDQTAQLSVNLPSFQLATINPARQAIRGQIRFDFNSLALIKELEPSINEVQGRLQAIIKLSGTLKKTNIEGDIKLLQAALSLPKMGINLNPIQFNLHSKANQWTLKSSLVSNGHPLNINGSGDFFPVVKGLLSIQGDMIPVMNTVEYAINVSPKLTFEFAPSSLKMRGQLLVPKALIKPRVFTETASLSDDVVFVSKASPPPNPYNIDTDVQVLMGDDVALSVKGLEGMLAGGVRVQQAPLGPLTAAGELSIREGKYRAYGQDLKIEQGQLLFTGGLIENPGIRVRATRQFKSTSNSLAERSQLFNFNSNNAQSLDFGGKVTVGIEVNGRLSKPIVRLFSVPSSLSQADILSMLLLGKPASQASQAGGQLLLTAVSALNLDSGSGGTQLLGQLKQKLGIDFNLANNTQYNQKTNQSTDRTTVVIGKSLSKRMYVSYNVGLSQNDSNVFTLSYLLNKFFSIQVNASTTASGIDLLYTHQKE
ncbi:translocation/assembly module TamB domain-containing protein [Legionella sp. CNM-4043-24]|uniref:translocation/assembly module TamB domain-containing protein n=1 Tax=Legionella sp. CNM-4043-24 TaxID=3421646 RepID=UPI00403B0D0B